MLAEVVAQEVPQTPLAVLRGRRGATVKLHNPSPLFPDSPRLLGQLSELSLRAFLRLACSHHHPLVARKGEMESDY